MRGGGSPGRNLVAVHVVLLTAFLLGYGFLDSLLHRLDWRTYDRLLHLRPPRPVHPEIALVVMDAASVAKLGQPPWPRSTHARLLDRLRESGVKAVGFDVAFVGPSEKAEDEALQGALKRHAGTVLVVDRLPGGQWLVPPFQANLALPYVVESGQIVREAPLAASGPAGQPMTTLGVEVARLHRGFSALPPSPVLGQSWAAVFALPQYAGTWGDEARVVISFPGTAVPRWSYLDVFEGRAGADRLRGRSVIVCSDVDARDVFRVPLHAAGGPYPAQVPGGEVHAYVVHTLLSGDVVKLTGGERALVIVLLAVLCGALSIAVRRKQVLGMAYVGLVLAVWTASAALLAKSSVWLPPIVPMLFVGASWLAVNLEEKWRTRRVFDQVLPSAVVDEALRSQAFLEGAGHKVDVTVLFSDIRGYTTISERLDPAEVTAMLQEYHRAMDPAFEAHGGTVFDYQGDAQMVVFGDPVPVKNHAAAAIQSAVRMREIHADLMKRREARGEAIFEMGIGLCSGEVQVQLVGGTKKQYVAIGDTTNVAARLQSLSEVLDAAVLMAESTYQRARGATGRLELEPLHPVALKGKTDKVMVYRVKGY